MEHCKDIPFAFAAVSHVSHDLPDEMDAESAGLPLGQRRADVGGWSRGQIERRSAIPKLEMNRVFGSAIEPNAGRVFQARAAPVADGVYEEFFQHQVELKLGIGGEAAGRTEFHQRGSQPFEFVDITIEAEGEFSRNGIECDTAKAGLSSVGRIPRDSSKLDSLGPAGFRGPKDGIDDGHVVEGVFQRNRRLASLLDRPAE